MQLFKSLIVASTLSLSFSGFADVAADKTAVDAACQAEAATAGCGTEQVGTGMLKCIHAYKKAHKDFKISDGCKAATKQLKTDHKAAKTTPPSP